MDTDNPHALHFLDTTPIKKERESSRTRRVIPFIYGTGGDVPNYKENLILWNKAFNEFFKPIKYTKMEQTKKHLTEGEKAVRLTFNPNALERVQTFKTTTAKAIDLVASIVEEVKDKCEKSNSDNLKDLGEFLREAAIAKTQLQLASMAGVLALTNDITFKVLTKDKKEEDDEGTIPPHQQRVLKEREELSEKLNALTIFINSSPIYSTLPLEEQEDLKQQADVMASYQTILDNRIKRF